MVQESRWRQWRMISVSFAKEHGIVTERRLLDVAFVILPIPLIAFWCVFALETVLPIQKWAILFFLLQVGSGGGGVTLVILGIIWWRSRRLPTENPARKTLRRWVLVIAILSSMGLFLTMGERVILDKTWFVRVAEFVSQQYKPSLP